MAKKKATAKRAMSQAHKDALAKGRDEGRKVRAYLQALEQDRQRSGRKASPEQVQQRIAEMRDKIDTEPDPARRVELIQRRIDLEDQLAAQHDEVDPAKLEHEFIDAIPSYAERKGIGYQALREIGVPAAVLRQAGIRRTRRT